MRTLVACIVTATITAGAAVGAGTTNIYQGGLAKFVGKQVTCQSAKRRVDCLVYYGPFEAKYDVSLAQRCITVAKYARGGAAQHLLWRRREC